MHLARALLLTSVVFAGISVGGCGGTVANTPPAVGTAGTAYTLPATPPTLSPEAQALRAQGPSGLAEALQRLDALPAGDLRRAAARELVDSVAQQRDAETSRLFWYTDQAEAQAAAASSMKPILSLRMLGSLTDEYSCANSRFFRAILYSDARIRQFLEQNFILHWSSERPAPLITIDFRDGRKVTRTITGNSIHYVMTATGQPIDALPGLVSQNAFLRWLADAQGLHERYAGGGMAALRDYHRQGLVQTQALYRSKAGAAGVAQAFPSLDTGAAPQLPRPSAALGIPVAPSKARVELPLAQAVLAPPAGSRDPAADGPVPALEAIPWRAIAPQYLADAALSPDGVRGLRRKSPQNWSNPAAPRDLTEPEFQELVTAFQASLAEDTAKNTLGMHALIHAWFLETPELRTFGELNKRVYATLFLTPKDDPWLGLVPARAFSGLDHDGVSTKR